MQLTLETITGLLITAFVVHALTDFFYNLARRVPDAKSSTMPFTEDSELELLFPANLIPADVQSVLHESLHMRPLASTDLSRGHMAVLRVLTQAPDPTPSAYLSQFHAMRACPNTNYTLVVVDRASDAIVGVGSVFIERKFLRGLGAVGHIEDIAVDEKQQGKKIGLRIIQALTAISENSGCYKTILNCSEHNIPFYKKCGYERKEVEMAKYAPERVHTPKL